MEAIKSWLQDWSDACVYARECAPDFGAFPIPDGEPFTALGMIAGFCMLTWAINERRIARRTPALSKTWTRVAGRTSRISDVESNARA